MLSPDSLPFWEIPSYWSGPRAESEIVSERRCPTGHWICTFDLQLLAWFWAWDWVLDQFGESSDFRPSTVLWTLCLFSKSQMLPWAKNWVHGLLWDALDQSSGHWVSNPGPTSFSQFLLWLLACRLNLLFGAGKKAHCSLLFSFSFTTGSGVFCFFFHSFHFSFSMNFHSFIHFHCFIQCSCGGNWDVLLLHTLPSRIHILGWSGKRFLPSLKKGPLIFYGAWKKDISEDIRSFFTFPVTTARGQIGGGKEEGRWAALLAWFLVTSVIDDCIAVPP